MNHFPRGWRHGLPHQQLLKTVLLHDDVRTVFGQAGVLYGRGHALAKTVPSFANKALMKAVIPRF